MPETTNYLDPRPPKSPFDRPAHDAPQVERIQEIRTRAENAREGPWALFRAESISIETMDGGYVVVDQVFAEEDEDAPEREHDALFLIHARQDIPYLLSRVATLEAEKQQLEDWKASALESLGRWHHLGEVLSTHVPLRLGEDIPSALALRVVDQLVALASLREAVREWKEAKQGWKDLEIDATSGEAQFACDALQDAEAKLRALVTPQQESE